MDFKKKKKILARKFYFSERKIEKKEEKIIFAKNLNKNSHLCFTIFRHNLSYISLQEAGY